MTCSLIARFSVGTAVGCVVRNSTCYYGLEPIRTELQKVATEIASLRFGTFVAPIIGGQIGLMCALPVTLLYGEMLSFVVKRLVFTIYGLVSSIFHELPARVAPPPIMRDIAMSIASFMAGFFAKTYFCNYAMPHVGALLRQVIVYSTPFLGVSFPVMLFIPAFVVMAAPSVTLLLGDFVSFATNQATYTLLHFGSGQILNVKRKREPPMIRMQPD